MLLLSQFYLVNHRVLKIFDFFLLSSFLNEAFYSYFFS